MDSISKFLPLLGTGLLVTILLAVISSICGCVLGLSISYIRRRQFRIVSTFIDLFTNLFVCVPPVVLLFILYYGLPFSVGGITLSAFAASALGLSLIFAASSARNFQFTLNSSNAEMTVKEVLAASTQDLLLQVIETVKHTALASFIVVPELFYTAKVWNASSLSGAPYLVAGLIYFLLLWPLLRVANRLRASASPAI
jgi:polar amino acid transport system permease protein